MKTKTIVLIGLIAVIGFVYLADSNKSKETGAGTAQEEGVTVADHRNGTFFIDGHEVTLIDGFAESETIPESASKITTRYFGNELITDLNADGVDDVAFILTQETGGSGTFYYAVGAIKTENGYVGTDGYLLGDRIAPQSTNISPNPRHKHVVVFNYAERAQDESMAEEPSIGQSVYLKVVPETLRWAIVMPDFEGESSLN